MTKDQFDFIVQHVEKEYTPLYLESPPTENKNVKSFLKALLLAEGDDFTAKVPATYFDEDCLVLQCGRFRNRSVSDLYYVVKTYIPTATLEDVCKAIASINITLFYCPDINKLVFNSIYKISKCDNHFYQHDIAVEMDTDVSYENDDEDTLWYENNSDYSDYISHEFLYYTLNKTLLK
jgi:hypothetical protein